MAPTLREDIVTLTPDLVHEAVRRFTAADGIFAVTERQVAGVNPTRLRTCCTHRPRHPHLGSRARRNGLSGLR